MAQIFESDMKIYNKLMTHYNTEWSIANKSTGEYTMDSLKGPLRTAVQTHVAKYPSLKEGFPNYRGIRHVAPMSKFNDIKHASFKTALDALYNRSTEVAAGDVSVPADLKAHRVNLYDYNAHTVHTNVDDGIVYIPARVKAVTDANVAAYPDLVKPDVNPPLVWETRQVYSADKWWESKGAFTAYEPYGDNTYAKGRTTYYIYPDDKYTRYVTDVTKEGSGSTSILKPTFTNASNICPSGPGFTGTRSFVENKPSKGTDTSQTQQKFWKWDNKIRAVEGARIRYTPFANLNDTNVSSSQLKDGYYDTLTCTIKPTGTSKMTASQAQNFVSNVAQFIDPKVLDVNGKSQYTQIVEQLCKDDDYAGIQLPKVAGLEAMGDRVCAYVKFPNDPSSLNNAMINFCAKNKMMPACKYFNAKAFDDGIDNDSKVLAAYMGASADVKKYPGIKEITEGLTAMQVANKAGYDRLNENLYGRDAQSYNAACLLGTNSGSKDSRTNIPRPLEFPECSLNLTVCNQSVPINNSAIAEAIIKLEQSCGTALSGGTVPQSSAAADPSVPVNSSSPPSVPVNSSSPSSVPVTTSSSPAPPSGTPAPSSSPIDKAKKFFTQKWQGQSLWVWFLIGVICTAVLGMLLATSTKKAPPPPSRGGGGWGSSNGGREGVYLPPPSRYRY